MYIYLLVWVSAVKTLYHTTNILDVNATEKFHENLKQTNILNFSTVF
jgi:hypothetical protein